MFLMEERALAPMEGYIFTNAESKYVTLRPHRTGDGY